jgi:outer membrane protein assembly factor BamE (lipoprotein component of BamABCDE complex)
LTCRIGQSSTQIKEKLRMSMFVSMAMRHKSMLAAFLGLAVLAGCAPEIRGNEAITETASVDQIIVGTTTRDQVRATFGAPESTAQVGPAEMWMYLFQRNAMNAATFMPGVGVLAGRSDVTTVAMSVSFDQNGVATNVVRNGSVGRSGALIRSTSQIVPC